MRSASSAVLALLFACSLALSMACSSPVAPTTTVEPHSPLERGAALYVTANRQRPRVVQALRSAGLKTTDQMQSGTYTLVVKVGKSRGSQPCGTTNNVVYDLRSAGGRVLVIKGRGQTGTCKPNVLDDMSKKLAGYW